MFQVALQAIYSKVAVPYKESRAKEKLLDRFAPVDADHRHRLKLIARGIRRNTLLRNEDSAMPLTVGLRISHHRGRAALDQRQETQPKIEQDHTDPRPRRFGDAGFVVHG